VEFPEVRYADADGVAIAYSVRGDGPADLVRIPGLMSGILAGAVDPVFAAHYEQLAQFSRLIVIDRRGQGLSDPSVNGGAPLWEQQVHDIRAVLDAVGAERVALLGAADGASVAVLFAAMHPERVSALVLYGPLVRFGSPGADSLDPAFRETLRLAMRTSWGYVDHPWGLEVLTPSRAGDTSFRSVLARVQQVSASPSVAVAATFMTLDADVRAVLPLVQAPTLVVCSEESGPPFDLLRHADVFVEGIPDARLARIPGGDSYLGVHTPEIGSLIEEFLTGARPAAPSSRVLATVLFTDIVGSTERLARIGDREWRVQLDQHDAAVREQLRRFGGREVNTSGDGFFATFDGPARAIGCARAIVDSAGEARDRRARRRAHRGV
jgi:pimeloyl-ACP methyl ester carboxylesterase